MDGIVVFTKDSCDRLFQSLSSISNLSRPVVVIDDSYVSDNKRENKNICKKYGSTYHGEEEQGKLLSKFRNLNIGAYISPLGNKSWSLGFNRNYAIIFSISFGYKKVVFSDDDILVPDSRAVDSIFENLQFHRHIGTDIELMPDDSVVGHIYRDGGVLQPRYVSGTFLGVNLEAPINNYYLNIYNEDWIWLHLENTGNPVFKVGKVDQLIFSPFDNGENRAISQEFGEICWEGVMGLGRNYDTNLLIDDSYWEGILDKRISDIKKINELNSHSKWTNSIQRIKNAILAYHLSLSSSEFSNTFRAYQMGKKEWKMIIDAAKAI